MNGAPHRKERGYALWVIFAVLLALIFAAWWNNQAKAKRKAQTEAVADESRREAERKATEQRVADAKAQGDALAASLKTIDGLVQRWEDGVRVAGSTSRIALSTPLANLQALQREAEALTVPPCLDQGKAELVAAMRGTVEGFLIFMRNELRLGDVLSQQEFEKAGLSMANFKAARAACPR